MYRGGRGSTRKRQGEGHYVAVRRQTGHRGVRRVEATGNSPIHLTRSENEERNGVVGKRRRNCRSTVSAARGPRTRPGTGRLARG